MIRIIVYVLLLVLLMGVAIFATQNLFTVTIKLLVFQSINLPLGLVLVFCAGIGGVVITFLQVGLSTSSNNFSPSQSSAFSQEFSNSSSRPSSTSSSSTSTKFQSPPKRSNSSDWDDDGNDDWV